MGSSINEASCCLYFCILVIYDGILQNQQRNGMNLYLTCYSSHHDSDEDQPINTEEVASEHC
jgi:hypothetical protein